MQPERPNEPMTSEPINL